MPMSRRRRIEFSISVKIQDVEGLAPVDLAAFSACQVTRDNGFIDEPRGFVESCQTLNTSVTSLISEYLDAFLKQEKKAGH
jgi:hypothetical protein